MDFSVSVKRARSKDNSRMEKCCPIEGPCPVWNLLLQQAYLFLRLIITLAAP